MDIQDLFQLFSTHPSIRIDSRKVQKGDLFFALKGERFDGNKFAIPALEAGAFRAIVDDPSLRTHPGCVWVEDVLESLQALAHFYRQQFSVPVLGITGSNGKTTTKELVAAVLSKKYKVHFTQGNLNNHIGVPLTLLAMPLDTEFAVIEMGANHQGEIDFLSRIADPDFGLITNIGKAHLEGFGGVEGIKKGKSELYRYLAEKEGTVFINRSERFLEDLAAPVTDKVFYGKSEKEVDFQIDLTRERPYLQVAVKTNPPITIDTQLHGAYNYGNIATAAAVGQYFEVAPADIASAIAAYVPENNRSQLIQKGELTIVLDAYNANPTSMANALESFASLEGNPKMVILGDMLELGEASMEEHRRILSLVQTLPIDKVVLVGPEFGTVADEFPFPHYEDREDLIRKRATSQLPARNGTAQGQSATWA
jgi:UDP-N-acetylmuramoyl-tripeptide--D-alanyl-D-alanine ligase